MSIAVTPDAQVGVVPVLRYRDVEEAVTWLSRAFGFEESRFVKDAEGRARYAQLACGDSMIMLCPVGGSAFDACMAQPLDAGGCETQISYVCVADVEAHKARAIEAGAEIVLDMVGGDGRGQGYSCRDLEGHIWSFGTYDPWRHAPRAAPAQARSSHRALAVAIASLALIAAVAAGYVQFNGTRGNAASSLANIENVLEKPIDLASAEKLLRQTREELMRERTQRMLAERQAQEQKDAAARERDTRTSSEKSLADVRKALAEKSDLLAKAEKAAADKPAVPVAVAAAPSVPTPIKACDAEAAAEMKSIRTASLAGKNGEELNALKVAMERAQAELAQERQSRAQRAHTVSELRSQLDRERHARERAEKQVRDALARIARLDPQRKPEPKEDASYYKDLSREIFPLPGRTPF